MHLTINDWIGFIGVFGMLLAYLMNLFGKISKDSLIYILLNMFGGGLSCMASWLINYLPFVVLEGTWTLVSLVALIRYFRARWV
ncbi:hypothetical protein A3860_02250 [Niastella vici]|uniref:CBU-0592-like domain-containing protein n=1 Tax=Niastella vici TaxID=1703345 RepID=A0A1V9G9J1_9BACT|nr:hypothetical protein [Niastella vici]OQP67204.1 hypothetical protein A3860_02250 [Niastella vici]